MKSWLVTLVWLLVLFLIDPMTMIILSIIVFSAMFGFYWLCVKVIEWSDDNYQRCLMRIRALERWHETHP